MKKTVSRIVPGSPRVFRTASVRGACSITVLLSLTAAAALGVGAFTAHWSAFALGAFALLVFLLVGTGIVPHAMAERLQASFAVRQPVRATFGRSTCIILLGEGTSFDPQTNDSAPSWIAGSRIVMAASLHRAALVAGSDCRVIIAGERTRADSNRSPGSYVRTLIALGVPSSHLLQESEGLNTYQHAKAISEMMKVSPVEKAYLVTSALHMKRALLYFNAFGLRPEPFASDHVHVPRLIVPIGYNFAVADIALHQFVGIVRFHIYEALGLNRRSRSGGEKH